MITHGHQNTITGHLFCTSIELLLVEAGVGSDIFDWDYQRFKDAITPGLAQHMWKFLLESLLYFRLSGMEMPLRHVYDCYLMQVFARKYKAPTLANLNRYRMHLQVTTPLSDVTTGDGMNLSHAALHGTQDNTQPHYYFWPVQPKPPTAKFHTWIQALTECFATDSKQLQRPLGAWIDLDDTWSWFYDNDRQRLFQQTADQWMLWIPTHWQQQRSLTQRFLPTNQLLPLPASAHQATIFFSGPFVCLSGTHATEYPPTTGGAS